MTNYAYTRSLRPFVAARSDWRCIYCGIKVETFGVAAGEGQIDHFEPRRYGGADVPDNLRLACAPCNGRKHSSSSDQLRLRLALNRMGAPLMPNAIASWIDATFGPIERARFWYEDNDLKPLVGSLPKPPQPYLPKQPKPPKPLYQAPQAPVAVPLLVSAVDWDALKPKRRPRPSDHLRDEVRRLRGEGLSDVEIGARVGRSPSWVSAVRADHRHEDIRAARRAAKNASK